MMAPRPAPTHFLCMPLATAQSRPQLGRSLAAFRADVTGPDASAPIPPSALRPVGTLHLTLGVFRFGRDDGDDLARAAEVLATLRGLGQGAAPSVTLRGLAAMQTAPERATVLYATPVQEEGQGQGQGGRGALQVLGERARDVFVRAGLMGGEARPLVLHATLVNTGHVRGRRGRGGRVTVDARGLLERYADAVWAEGVEVARLAICTMGARRVVVGGVEDAAYEVVAEVEL